MRWTTGLVACVVGMIVATSCSSSATEDRTTRDESGEIVDGGELGALRLREGDCFLDMEMGTVESVDAVPCTQTHMYEVYATFELPGGSSAAWPGTSNVEELAGEGCFDRFEPFVDNDYETSAFGFMFLTPTEGSWSRANDREIVCLVFNYDGTTKTGSARNARR